MIEIPNKDTLSMTYGWLKGCKHVRALYIPPARSRFLTNWLTDTEKADCKRMKGKLPWTTWNSAWKAMLVDYEYTMESEVFRSLKTTLDKENL
tara:strand:+ start:608 stop:886 length:279 start_codon:yes stop_codon:yes gene_type:complete